MEKNGRRSVARTGARRRRHLGRVARTVRARGRPGAADDAARPTVAGAARPTAAARGPAASAAAHGAVVRDAARGGHGLQGDHRPGQGGLLLPVRQPRRDVLRQRTGA